ncbi:hypothetical protein [Paenibacillus pasadenensis]|uniref:hypothetical protein n=1 Tax=Paenibacillus pasadenensis TaxID=217090 RepID=UPI000C7D7780|nr:hypothetical protein [Paenibacillus pasadenensis]
MIIIDLNQLYQPYFAAFVTHHGYQTGDEVHSWVYTGWIGGKWKEWRRLHHKTETEPLSAAETECFHNWLLETSSPAMPLRRPHSNEDEIEEAKMLARLQRMIRTANKAADQKHYIHTDVELGVIRRVMEAKRLSSVPAGVERVVGHYYTKMTGRTPYY